MTLSILGGNPLIQIPRPHFKWPKIGQEEINAVIKQLESGIITYYTKDGGVKELEDQFAQYHGLKYAISTNSGTSAIHSALFGCGIEHGDEVIACAYSYSSCVMPILSLNATPVLVDADEKTGNIDPQKIEKAITSKTKAVIIVHSWGHPCDMDHITEICKKHNLFLIEDCAHAIAATYSGKKVGTFGDVSCFSFQGKKIIPAGEGGMLLTNSSEIHDRATLLGHLRYRSLQCVEDEFYKEFYLTGYGFKYHIHPLAAVLALEGLKKMEERIEQRSKNLAYLSQILEDIPGVSPPITYHNVTRGAFYGYRPFYVKAEMDNIPMGVYIEALQAEGVDIYQPNLPPLNMLPMFQRQEDGTNRINSKVIYKNGDFPGAEAYFNSTFSLPTFSFSEDIELIELYGEAFIKVYQHRAELKEYHIAELSRENS